MTSKTVPNKIVAITRPFERAEEAVKMVEEKGGVPLVAPTLELQILNSKPLVNLCKTADKFDWLIFTSPTGILSVFKHCKDLKNRLKPECKIAVIGPRTAKFLMEKDWNQVLFLMSTLQKGFWKFLKILIFTTKK